MEFIKIFFLTVVNFFLIILFTAAGGFFLNIALEKVAPQHWLLLALSIIGSISIFWKLNKKNLSGKLIFLLILLTSLMFIFGFVCFLYGNGASPEDPVFSILALTWVSVALLYSLYMAAIKNKSYRKRAKQKTRKSTE